MTGVSAKYLRRRRGAKIRRRHAALGAFRIAARLSGRHTYAQIMSPDGKYSNIAAAAAVGRELAGRASKLDLGRLAFDRGGRKYHGRIRALAEAMREGGLKF